MPKAIHNLGRREIIDQQPLSQYGVFWLVCHHISNAPVGSIESVETFVTRVPHCMFEWLGSPVDRFTPQLELHGAFSILSREYAPWT